MDLMRIQTELLLQMYQAWIFWLTWVLIASSISGLLVYLLFLRRECFRPTHPRIGRAWRLSAYQRPALGSPVTRRLSLAGNWTGSRLDRCHQGSLRSRLRSASPKADGCN